MDYISSLFIIAGLVMIGKQNKYGWITSIIGSLGYIYVSIEAKLYGMLLLNVVMAVIGIINFIKWNKKEQKNLI
jgi:nicotinamide riboside transporter PnuC